MENYYVYILYSPSRDRYYVGYSGNLRDRLRRHNGGGSKSTKGGRPWYLVYTEVFSDSSLAYQREQSIKRRKSRRYIEDLVRGYLSNPLLLR